MAKKTKKRTAAKVGRPRKVRRNPRGQRAATAPRYPKGHAKAGQFIPATALAVSTPRAKPKKKRGRPVGSKNRTAPVAYTVDPAKLDAAVARAIAKTTAGVKAPVKRRKPRKAAPVVKAAKKKGKVGRPRKAKRGRPRGVTIPPTLMLPRAPGVKVPSKYALRRNRVKGRKNKAGKQRSRYSYTTRIEKNSGKAFVNDLIDGALGFGTLLALRAVNGLVKTALKPSATEIAALKATYDSAYAAATAAPTDTTKAAAVTAAKAAYDKAMGTSTAFDVKSLLGLIPPAIALVGSSLAKGKIKEGARVFDAMAFGASVALFEKVGQIAVAAAGKSTEYGHLVGLGEYVVQPLGEYIVRPPDYVPVGEYVMRPAMAEYVPDPGNAIGRGTAMGGDEYVVLEEALAEDDAEGLQEGYGSGVLKGTVFTDR